MSADDGGNEDVAEERDPDPGDPEGADSRSAAIGSAGPPDTDAEETGTEDTGAEGAALHTWHRLDRRTVLVSALRWTRFAVVAGIPAAVGLAGRIQPWLSVVLVLVGGVLLIGVGVLVDAVRWRRTRYRVLPQRFELRQGVLVRSSRSLNRERIRSVDITAPMLLRLFGLVHVKIGTAERLESRKSSLILNPVSHAAAERLRHELLDRPAVAGSTPGAHHPTDGRLATFEPSWTRFAPASVLTPALGATAFGGTFQVAEWFGMQDGVVTWVLDRLRVLPLPMALLVLVLTGLAVGALASVAVFVEMWWRFRLDREPNGTLRVRRGLFTTRSVSLEERRLRGVELVQPLGNRLLGAARVDAVATGLSQQRADQRADHKTLHPAAPRGHVDAVAATVLREPVPPTEAVRLRAHPRAARDRRLRWALLTVAVPLLAPVVLGLTVAPVLFLVAAGAALVLVPLAVAWALDAYTGLGHGITGDYLVTRHGSVRRATVALQRKGVIGWTARQSLFQRRKGLITLTATTAAGAGAYSAYDVDVEEGLAFADAAVPDLLGPFLERRRGNE